MIPYRRSQSDVGYVIPEKLELLVALVVLLAEVLILLLEFPQLVRNPLLDPCGFGLNLTSVLQS